MIASRQLIRLVGPKKGFGWLCLATAIAPTPNTIKEVIFNVLSSLNSRVVYLRC